MDHLDSDSLHVVLHHVMRYHYYRTHTILEKVGVYPGQPPLLFALWKQNGQSQGELAKRLHLQPATITVMLRRMEKAQLVERRHDLDDQRVSRAYLTPKGEEVRVKVVEALKTLETECFAGLASEEQALLRRFLLQMRDNLAEACAAAEDG